MSNDANKRETVQVANPTGQKTSVDLITIGAIAMMYGRL